VFADPFAEADEDTGQVKQTQQDYIHIRIQRASLTALAH
jgi:translation initiation factor 1